MGKFFKELIKGSKWVLIALVIVAMIVSLFIGCAWCLGWIVDRTFDLTIFGPQYYIAFGSLILSIVLIIQIITIILTLWFLLAWGNSRGLIQKKGKE